MGSKSLLIGIERVWLSADLRIQGAHERVYQNKNIKIPKQKRGKGQEI